jgi:[ribosomal protein S18]-alanine N-acetyltransferase
LPVINHDTLGEMKRGHIDAILSIEKVSFLSPWTRVSFEEALTSSISKAFVAETEGRVVAYVVLYSFDDEAHILNIAVDPQFRQRGWGTRMLSFVIERCGALGVKDYFLEVRESNEPAIGLYRAFGFKAVGRRKRYYSESNEDALVMQLTVDAPWTGQGLSLRMSGKSH